MKLLRVFSFLLLIICLNMIQGQSLFFGSGVRDVHALTATPTQGAGKDSDDDGVDDRNDVDDDNDGKPDTDDADDDGDGTKDADDADHDSDGDGKADKDDKDDDNDGVADTKDSDDDNDGKPDMDDTDNKESTRSGDSDDKDDNAQAKMFSVGAVVAVGAGAAVLLGITTMRAR